ncbi:VanW family protein [Ureibacillus manganicus]|uniref:G5 domain-containing protein n=1 Tax=Ureibacillus manganicus DSM 26584 TaxID=1384049 RepID=A0A0A3IA18_9BACL|nr:VanW family protein [Ureibacillus manganicus]KGR79648.1 hypothetical protein CD29_06000 [Ureibacillus manganicus DSM 26584]
MKIQFKMFTLAVMCIFLLYMWLPTQDIMRVFADDESNGSTIAGVNVNGLDPEEIESVLQDAVNVWMQEDIKVIGGEIGLIVDSSKLQFDIPSTITEFQTLVKKPWYAFWDNERVIHIPLKVAENEEIKNEVAKVAAWDTDETYNQLISQVSFLMDHKVEAKVKQLDAYNTERLALAISNIPSDAFAPVELVTLLDGKMVNPDEEFSFIETVNENINKVNNESLNFVSSLLYNAVLQTEFEILERHQSKEVPTSVEIGTEAVINVNVNEDLRFLNNTKYVGKINASFDGNSLKVEITSDTKFKEVNVTVDKEILMPRMIYRYSNDLPLGQQQLLQDGKEGYRVIVTRTISGNGTTQEQRISRDYYPPVNEIILKSSKQPDPISELQPNTGEYDSNMEIDLDGDGLPDIEVPVKSDDEPTTYDKSGDSVTP